MKGRQIDMDSNELLKEELKEILKKHGIVNEELLEELLCKMLQELMDQG
jgi:hypothetical protein